MKKLLLLFALGAVALSVSAEDPQLVVHRTDGSKHVARVRELDRLAFTSSGIELRPAFAGTTEYFPYGEVEKIAVDYEGTQTGVVAPEGAPTSVRAFPSPATEYIIVSGQVGADGIRIYNTAGECIVSIPDYDGGQISVSALPAGLYLVKAGLGSAKFFKN